MAIDNQFKETVDALFKGMNGVPVKGSVKIKKYKRKKFCFLKRQNFFL